jgi:hypothetical protein
MAFAWHEHHHTKVGGLVDCRRSAPGLWAIYRGEGVRPDGNKELFECGQWTSRVANRNQRCREILMQLANQTIVTIDVRVAGVRCVL